MNTIRQVTLTIERAVKSVAGMSVDPENACTAGTCTKYSQTTFSSIISSLVPADSG